MSTYQFGQLESFYSKLHKGESELSAKNPNKFKQIYDSWMENSSFAKFEKPKDATSNLVFTKFIRKSKSKQAKMPIEFSPESTITESSKKMKVKTKKKKKSFAEYQSEDEDVNTTPLNGKKNSKVELSDTVSAENQDDILSSEPLSKKKKKRKMCEDQLSNADENVLEVGSKKNKKCKVSQDNSISVQDGNTTPSEKSPLSKKALKLIKKMSKMKVFGSKPDSETKEDNESLTNVETVSETNENSDTQQPLGVDNTNVASIDGKRKKKKKKKRKSSGNMTVGNFDEAGDSEVKGQDESEVANEEIISNKMEASDEVSVDTSGDSQRKRKKKNKKGKNASFQNSSPSENSIREEGDENDVDEETEEPKKKKKKKGKNISDALVEDDITDLQMKLAKKEAKLLKKRNKALKGIVSGVGSEPELTKFSLKSEEDEFDDDDNVKQEDKGSSESEQEEEHSFPRTPNDKQFVLKVDSEEKMRRTLFVGNLPTDTDKKTLTEIFKPYGKVESVRMRCAVPKKPSITKKIANMTHEYSEETTSLKGFVVFTNQEDAEKALAMNGTVFNGHHLRVDKAHGPSQQNQNGKAFGGNQQNRNDKVFGGNQQNRGSQNNFRPDRNDNLSVFVGNLPYTVDDETLWNTFGSCGSVKAVRIVHDRETGAGKGFGFVEFQDNDGVEAALSVSGTEVGGRQIRVSRCERNQQRSQPWQSRGGGPRRGNFGFRKFGQREQQDSGPRKTFKKFNESRKRDQEKKKIAAIFSTEKKSP